MISKIPKWVWIGVAFLALSAGFINVVAFLGFTHKAITHVTGNLSVFSSSLYKGDTPAIIHLLILIFSFFLGSVLSGAIIMDGHLKLGRSYGVALFIEAFLLLAATFCFLQNSFWGEALASMACGLQNAMVSTYSGAIIRTTHMTGVLTDLGSLIGQFIQGMQIDVRRLKIHSLIISSFIVGGYLGSVCFTKLSYQALFIPSILILSLAIIYTVILFQSKTKS